MEPPAVAKSLAVFILADVSGSMAGAPLKAMQEGFGSFSKELRKHPDSSAILLSMITYGRAVTQAAPLGPVVSFTVPVLSAGGFTPLGDALQRAAAQAVKQPRALVLIVSDGHATDEFAPSAAALAAGNIPCVLASLKPAELHAAPGSLRAKKVKLARGDAAGNLFVWLAGVVRATFDAQAYPPLPAGVVPWLDAEGEGFEAVPPVPATQPREDDEIIVPQPEAQETRRKTTILAAQPSTRREAAEEHIDLEARPYFNNSIAELEALAVTTDVSILHLLDDELGHRNTARAHDLKTAIQLKLNKRPAPAVLAQPPLPARKRGGLFDHLIGA